MMNLFSSKISITCCLGGIKNTEVNSLSVDAYISLIFATFVRFANSSVRILFWTFTFILHIFSTSAFAKVFNAIVQFILVNMIDIISRPLSGVIKPNQSMSKITASVNLDRPISTVFTMQIASRFAKMFRFLTFSPNKITIVVFKGFKDLSVCNHTMIIPNYNTKVKEVW